MTIVPASRLSSTELAMLGNNLDPRRRRGATPQRRRELRAVNRSLALLGEKVGRLWPASPVLAFRR